MIGCWAEWLVFYLLRLDNRSIAVAFISVHGGEILVHLNDIHDRYAWLIVLTFLKVTFYYSGNLIFLYQIFIIFTFRDISCQNYGLPKELWSGRDPGGSHIINND